MAESTVTADSKLTSSILVAAFGQLLGPLQVIWSSGRFLCLLVLFTLLRPHLLPFRNTTTQLLQTAGVFAAGFLMAQ